MASQLLSNQQHRKVIKVKLTESCVVTFVEIRCWSSKMSFFVSWLINTLQSIYRYAHILLSYSKNMLNNFDNLRKSQWKKRIANFDFKCLSTPGTQPEIFFGGDLHSKKFHFNFLQLINPYPPPDFFRFWGGIGPHNPPSGFVTAQR
jgi:hypothetical protein